LGFRKKANNFYRFKDGVGHHINVQKSRWSDKYQISFTINTGVFIPELWDQHYNYFSKPTHPDFPTESECELRRRIGRLKNISDQWYEINSSTDDNNMIIDMWDNLHKYILPHFSKLESKEIAMIAIKEGMPE